MKRTFSVATIIDRHRNSRNHAIKLFRFAMIFIIIILLRFDKPITEIYQATPTYDEVDTVSWGRNNKIAAAHDSGILKILSDTGTVLESYLLPNSIGALAWGTGNNTNTLALASSLGGTIWVLENKQIRILDDTFFHGYAGIGSIAWSSDGSKIATGTNKELSSCAQSSIGVWEVSSGALLQRIDTNCAAIGRSFVWRPFSNDLAAGFGDFTKIGIWNASNGSLTTTLTVPNNSKVVQSSYTPQGDMLIAIGGYISLWNTSDYQLVYSKKLNSTVGAFQLDYSGKYIALINYDNSYNSQLMIFVVKTGAQVYSKSFDENIILQSLAWSPDGKKIFLGGYYNNDGTSAEIISDTPIFYNVF